MSYAIIELGGRQYRVAEGDSLVVDRLDAKEGTTVRPRAVLYRSDKTILDRQELEDVKVDALVTGHLKGAKLRVFKYRPKKRYRRRAGHRSLLTRLEIKQIHAPSAAKAAGRSAKERAKPADGSGKGRSKAAAAAAKTAARKPRAKAKPSRTRAGATSASGAEAAKKRQTTGKGRARKGSSKRPTPKKKRSTKED